MRVRYFYSLLLLLALAAAMASRAQAQTQHDCHDSTIEALYHCVEHAIQDGHITSVGVATSLISKLDAAQRAELRGRRAVAARIVGAFIYEVQAQAGIHVDEGHAEHMVAHAQEVIARLLSD